MNGIADTIIKAAPMMITCSIQSEEASARKCPVNTAQTFIKKYGIMAQKLNSAIPHVHPHLFRHTRAMHLYMAGMPLELVSQWLGHSQLETSLIYARATTDMKRKAVDKISAKENSVFKSDEKFKYADNEDVIRQLYGLM